MSYVILAVRRNHAVIVSDGAVTFVADDGGGAQRARNDYPKFRSVGGVFVIAACGECQFSERLWSDAKEFVARSPGLTFASMAQWFAAHVPKYASGPSDSAALAGYDHAAGRPRLVLCFAENGFAPIDTAYASWGAVPDPRGLLHKTLAERGSIETLALSMRRLLKRFARQSDRIGGGVYQCVIGREGVSMRGPLPDLEGIDSLAGAVPASAVAAHALANFTAYTATKTVNYAPQGYIERTSPPSGLSNDSNGNISMDGALTSSSFQIVDMNIMMPGGTTGLTMTQVALDVFYNNSLGSTLEVDWFFTRKTGGGGAAGLASGSASQVGWQTLTASLSENTLGRSYEVEVQRRGGNFGPALGNVAITYAMGDPKQTL